jgi:hypothetical protein
LQDLAPQPALARSARPIARKLRRVICLAKRVNSLSGVCVVESCTANRRAGNTPGQTSACPVKISVLLRIPGGQAPATQAQYSRIAAPVWPDVSHAVEGRRPVQTDDVFARANRGRSIHRPASLTSPAATGKCRAAGETTSRRARGRAAVLNAGYGSNHS